MNWPKFVRYTVSVPHPETHYAEIEASFPTNGCRSVELYLPVWTPGSYKIRDYSKHIEGLLARTLDGGALVARKSAKNRWLVETEGAATVLVSYRVYGFELTVRTNYIDSEFALLHGAATFLALTGSQTSPHFVEVVSRAEWHPLTLLPRDPNQGSNHFLAPDYDALVDSPILMGCPTVRSFLVSGVEYRLADVGKPYRWDGEKAVTDLQKIIEAETRFWGTVPFSSYTFINLLTGGYGGLEHRAGTVLMADPLKMGTRSGYLEWLALASHEFFHAWNVKRLRPNSLEPFDYERETDTRALWFVEGITSYYDDLFVHRAGLSTREEYLAALSKNILRLQTTPGRRVRSLEEAAGDAWIKLYQPDANSTNSTISYYIKGAVVAFLLDTRIRIASKGKRSLDDLMRTAYSRFSGAHGFQPDEIEQLISEVAGSDQSSFLELLLRTTEELPYFEALDHFGLEFVSSEKPAASEGSETESPGWLGGHLRANDGRWILSTVPQNTPAFNAGLSPGDELIAIDGIRLPKTKATSLFDAYRPDDPVGLTVARRSRLRTIQATLGKQPNPQWRLALDTKASADQQTQRDRWLKGLPDRGFTEQ